MDYLMEGALLGVVAVYRRLPTYSFLFLIINIVLFAEVISVIDHTRTPTPYPGRVRYRELRSA